MRNLVQKTLLAAALSMSGAATASENEYAITYSKSELESVTGQRAVLRRIQAAAKSYCPDYLEIRSHYDVRMCINGVVDDLVASIKHPRFTAFVEAQRRSRGPAAELVAKQP
ncbi:MAG: UrcA family protein [Pseudomonadales bacterium]